MLFALYYFEQHFLDKIIFQATPSNIMTISLSGLVDRSTALRNPAIWERQNVHLLEGVSVDKSQKGKTTKRTKKKEKRDSQEHDKVLKHNSDGNS